MNEGIRVDCITALTGSGRFKTQYSEDSYQMNSANYVVQIME
jgi:hypothetical protein